MTDPKQTIKTSKKGHTQKPRHSLGICTVAVLVWCALAGFSLVAVKWGADAITHDAEYAFNNSLENARVTLLGLAFGAIAGSVVKHIGIKYGPSKNLPVGKHSKRRGEPQKDRLFQGMGYGTNAWFGAEGCGIANMPIPWCRQDAQSAWEWK